MLLIFLKRGDNYVIQTHVLVFTYLFALSHVLQGQTGITLAIVGATVAAGIHWHADGRDHPKGSQDGSSVLGTFPITD